jgi:hypothetical protein
MNNNAHRQDDGTRTELPPLHWHGYKTDALCQSGCPNASMFIRLVPFFQLKKLTTYKDTVAVADLVRHLSRYLA